MRQSPNFLHAITICLLCAGCGAAPPSRAAHASGADGEALDVEDAVAELVSLAHPDAGNLIQTCGVARLSLIPEAKVSYVGPYVSHLPWSILRAMRPSAYVQFSTADEGASFGTLLFSVRASQRVVQRAGCHLALENAMCHFELFNSALGIFESGRRSGLTNPNSRAGRVDETDRLVG